MWPLKSRADVDRADLMRRVKCAEFAARKDRDTMEDMRRQLKIREIHVTLLEAEVGEYKACKVRAAVELVTAAMRL